MDCVGHEILTNFLQPRGHAGLPVQLRRYRDMSPSSGPAGPGGSGAAGVGPGAHQGQQRPRRLSRVVKCRTVDFTEFPEGMRDYARNGKRLLREIQSQPGSPTLIPRIEIHDFGSEVQPILSYFCLFFLLKFIYSEKAQNFAKSPP